MHRIIRLAGYLVIEKAGYPVTEAKHFLLTGKRKLAVVYRCYYGEPNTSFEKYKDVQYPVSCVENNRQNQYTIHPYLWLQHHRTGNT